MTDEEKRIIQAGEDEYKKDEEGRIEVEPGVWLN